MIMADFLSIIFVLMQLFSLYNAEVIYLEIGRFVCGFIGGCDIIIIIIYNKEMSPDAINEKCDDYDLKPFYNRQEE